MLALMVAAILVGFPTAFTLMSLGITFGYLGMGFLVFDLAVQRVFFVMQNDVLVAGVPVPRLYAGAFLPGFMLSSLYLGYIVLWAKFRPHDAPNLSKEQQEHLTASQTLVLIFRGFVPIVTLILFVLGAIFFGLATPSEGAALGALGGIILAAAHKRLSFSMLRESVFLTVRTAAMVG